MRAAGCFVRSAGGSRFGSVRCRLPTTAEAQELPNDDFLPAQAIGHLLPQVIEAWEGI
jgi:hypothetical protein